MLNSLTPISPASRRLGTRVVTSSEDENRYAPSPYGRRLARCTTSSTSVKVVVATTFTDVDDVVQRANRLPYGLGAYLFSSSLEVTTRVPRLHEAGLIGVNEFNLGGVDTYFGGVKDSGYGSEGGPEAVRGYLVPKLINEVSPVGSRRAEG